MASLSATEAAALVKAKYGARYRGPMALPAFRAADVLAIDEVPLRDGAYVDIYVARLWPGLAKRTGPGVSVFSLERVGRRWSPRSGSTSPARSARPADLDRELEALRERRAYLRPKPVAVAPARRAKRVAAIAETKGAGSLAGITPTGTKRAKACTVAEVDAAERKLGVRFVAGYRTFVTTLGQGLLAGRIRIHPPRRIAREHRSWRSGIEQHWFWGEKPVAQAHALEGYRLGDTIDGDVLLVLPDDPDRVYLLPRHSETSRALGRGLAAVIGRLVRKKRPSFTPF